MCFFAFFWKLVCQDSRRTYTCGVLCAWAACGFLHGGHWCVLSSHWGAVLMVSELVSFYFASHVCIKQGKLENVRIFNRKTIEPNDWTLHFHVSLPDMVMECCCHLLCVDGWCCGGGKHRWCCVTVKPHKWTQSCQISRQLRHGSALWEPCILVINGWLFGLWKECIRHHETAKWVPWQRCKMLSL